MIDKMLKIWKYMILSRVIQLLMFSTSMLNFTPSKKHVDTERDHCNKAKELNKHSDTTDCHLTE